MDVGAVRKVRPLGGSGGHENLDFRRSFLVQSLGEIARVGHYYQTEPLCLKPLTLTEFKGVALRLRYNYCDFVNM